MKKLIIILAAAVVLFGTGFAKAGTWTTVDYPGASQTRIRDIDGGNLVGTYQDNSGLWHGFLRSGTTWATLDAPGAVSTYAYGIGGSNIVGGYTDASDHIHGFLYDGSNWTTIDAEGAYNTCAYDIDSGIIVGSYDLHGFIYDGTAWTTLDKDGASGTYLHGIDGGNIMGYFWDNSPTSVHDYRGFVYDGTNWAILDAPVKIAMNGFLGDTQMYGISGSNVVGVGTQGGFLYNGTTWEFLNVPGATATKIWGIDGELLVGSYRDSSNKDHGFVYEVPEPACAMLIIVGAAIIGLRHKRQ